MIKLLLKIWDNSAPIYNELGINWVGFDATALDEGAERIASVRSSITANIEDNKEDFDFVISYESKIEIYENYLNSFIEDLIDCLDKKSEKIFKLLRTACLENAIVHELKHLHQFSTLKLTEDNIDIIKDDEEKTFIFVFNKETKFILEKEANEYSLSKSNITLLKDKELKTIMSNLEYNNVFINIYSALLVVKIGTNEDTSEEEESIIKYRNEVKRWFDILNTHINEKY